MRIHLFHPSFYTIEQNSTFALWYRSGIKTVRDLIMDNLFPSFQQLVEKYSLPNHSFFFRYLQARNFVKKTFSNFPNLPDVTIFHNFLAKLAIKGIVTILYNLILSLKFVFLRNIKTVWEVELATDIDDDIWTKCLKRVHTSSISARHGLKYIVKLLIAII